MSSDKLDGLGARLADFPTLGAWVADWGSTPPSEPFGEFSDSDFNYAALRHIV